MKKLYNVATEIEDVHEKSITSFIENNRKLAIEAITLHRNYQKKISNVGSSLDPKKEGSMQLINLVFTFEKLSRCWADVADLVKPVYT
jgi:hypothetical protein